MTDMVERVARALYADWAGDDSFAEYPAWENLEDKADWLGQARSAITAMHSTTKEMAEAGILAAEDALDHDWDSGCDGESYNSYSYLRSDAPSRIWQAMIDAALTPVSPRTRCFDAFPHKVTGPGIVDACEGEKYGKCTSREVSGGRRTWAFVDVTARNAFALALMADLGGGRG